MSGILGFPGVAKLLPDEKEHRRQIAQMLNDQVNRGKFNCTVSVTLAVSPATTTTLTDERIGYGSYIDFMPTTASAATAKASIYVTNRIKGSLTINHAANAAIDQTFTVVILG